MNAFTASAVALLSRYSNNLLKEDAQSALSAKTFGDGQEIAKIVQTIISFIDSFDDNEYLVRGLYRISGSLSAQQNALNIIENAKGTPLKLYFIYELAAEDKASCVKTLLRKMPDTLFPQCQRAALMDLTEVAKQIDLNGENEHAFRALQILVYFIPDLQKRCLERLLIHLAKVAAHSDENKMDISNLSLLFCSYIFPVAKDHNNMEEAKEEIERFSRLFPLLLRHIDELFHLSDELLETLDASLMKQALDHNLSGSRYSSPFLTPLKKQSLDDPEVVMVQSCSTRVLTPTKSTTDLEMAKLAAEIASMSDGPKRRRLLKKIQCEQRQKLGIRKIPNLLKKTFTPKK